MPAGLFPDGMRPLGDVVRHLGLTFGVWTAPFEVSERAWVVLSKYVRSVNTYVRIY